jgi:type I restriction enzyme, S subunit
MGSEWPNVKIEDIQADVKGSIAIGPFGSRMKSECYVQKGVPVIRGTNITGGPQFEGNFVYITTEMADKLGSCNVYEGDLVFPHRGAIGEVGIVSDGNRYIISSSLMKLTCDKQQAEPKFVYYFFKSRQGKYQLLKNASQVGTPGIGQPLASLKAIDLRLPDLKTQRRIAGIMSSLDNKIALNHQTNTTLESMAQALFKSWFVDFDPVIDNALAAGNPIPEALKARAETRAALGDQRKPLPDQIRQQFPDRFVLTEEMGWVPKGWAMVTLNEVTEKIGSGATPRGGKQAYVDSGTALIRSQNVYDSGFTWKGLAYVTQEAADQLQNVTVEPGDVLLNITGASILRTCLVTSDVLPARVNQHVAIIRARKEIPPRYLHLLLQQRRTKNYLMGLNAGASREAVTKGHIESVPTLRPDKCILNEFKLLTDPMYQRVEKLHGSSRSLSMLRDTLLPKLLSGELRVPEAERELEEVAL